MMLSDFDAPALWLHRPGGDPVIVNWGQVTRVHEQNGETYIVFTTVLDGMVDFEVVKETIDQIYTELTGSSPAELAAQPLPPGELPSPMRPGPPPETSG